MVYIPKLRFKTIIGTLFRLVPLPAETGLRAFGSPNEDSPVFVTANYDLTVRRVSKYLNELDCYLLVVQSKGINVWCAADGGFLNAHSIISAIKTSGLNDKVRHRTLILPQLSAPGIEVKLIAEKTGWRCKFGPVYAKDILAYANNNFKKTKNMRTVKFDLIDRLDVGVGVSFFAFILIPLVLLLFLKAAMVTELITLAFALLLLMYTLYPYMPGQSGYRKIIFCESIAALCFLAYLFISPGHHYNYLFYGAMIFIPMIGLDWGGVSPDSQSDLDPILARIGVKKIGPANFKGTERISLLDNSKGIKFDSAKCTGCGLCFEVCPKCIYKIDKSSHKARVAGFQDCIKCRACSMQCPTNAIFIG